MQCRSSHGHWYRSVEGLPAAPGSGVDKYGISPYTDDVRVIFKIWLDKGGIAFGEGPYRLLRGVETTGSLWQAAAALQMAYAKARHLISCCERSLGFALTTRKIGGASGGGSRVMPEAVKLMREYEEVREEIKDALAKAYKRHFGEPAEVRVDEVKPRKRRKKEKQES